MEHILRFPEHEAGATIHAASVADDVKAWLFPQLSSKLSAYFNFVSKSSYLEKVGALLDSDTYGQQGLGAMLAIDPQFYPASDQDAVDMDYPPKLLRAIFKSKLMNSQASYVYQRVRGQVFDPRFTILCEEFEKRVAPTLRNGFLLNEDEIARMALKIVHSYALGLKK